jgi:quercetin dioxygenase-like cupin family protein
MLKRITTDFRFEDSRGTIVQLVHEGYSQINVITSKKGVFRGGHYHKDNNEAFYIISGKLEVTVNKETTVFTSGDFFGIEAYDIHSFNFLEDTTLVSMYSHGVEKEDGTKDIYTE